MYYLKIYRLLHFLNIESYLLLLLIIIIFMLIMKNIPFSKASQDILKKKMHCCSVTIKDVISS